MAEPIGKQLCKSCFAQITWYHHIALLNKVKDAKEREWYIRQAIQNGWSRNVLVHQIESGLRVAVDGSDYLFFRSDNRIKGARVECHPLSDLDLHSTGSLLH
ncbi:DUF1016 N-terminal domain-containing protein [Methanoregula sp.]|uniref:DUF1016 N-terminal domain-containing protein n=1 Tax=Methanoregula sp. TaxID=2052170 RepID=UPI003BB0A0A1